MKTVCFQTLGCKLNFSETSTLARQFRQAGFGVVHLKDGADVVVINTCSVTENADRKCQRLVRQALKHNPSTFVIVVGCYAQLKPQEIAEIDGVDAVLGAAEKFRLLELVQEFTKRGLAEIYHSPVGDAREFVPTHSESERTRAFLKVQDGCDYKCSFCTIPQARGRSRSATPAEALAEAEGLATRGAREIVLTGINLGDYQGPAGESLLDLLQLFDEQLPAVERFRLSSVEPNLLSDAIIDFLAERSRFMPHLHMPLQSGSNRILAAMRRRYRRELYADRVAHIKARMPEAAIGVDVIVGFPGETAADFEETYAFLTELDVTYLHVFPYSERDNTPAASMPGAVPQPVRAERAERLRQLSAKKRHHFNAQFLNSERKVLVERAEDGWLSGHTDNYIKVNFADAEGGMESNALVPVSLAEHTAKGEMSGRVVHTAVPV